MRQTRKLEHIEWAVELPDGPLSTGFADLKIVHNALPERDLADINTAVKVFDRVLQAPVIINALTGGNPEVLEINRSLAVAAAQAGLGIAVGSQTAAVLEPGLAETFAVVRRENPQGLVLANVGANAAIDAALKAIDMVEADALQVHLNVPQELAMLEGDRQFRGIERNIGELIKVSPVPVIVKEVGFGISKEVAARLTDLGVTWLDVGGAGGTNFIRIEHHRGKQTAMPEDWGIPTVVSLLEVLATSPGTRVIASGGIRSPLECLKALALGSSLIGIAGWWLKVLCSKTEDELLQELDLFKQQLKELMLLVGAQTVAGLRSTPVVITGCTKEWLQERGVDTRPWARRS